MKSRQETMAWRLLMIVGKHALAFLLGVALIFALTLGLPDAAYSVAGAYSTQETIQNLRAELDLDGPAIGRFASYWRQFFSGSLRGFYTREPLLEVLPAKLVTSAGLFVSALGALAVLTALWLATFVLLRKAPLTQNLLVSGAASVPLFISTTVVLYLCTALKLPLWLGGALALGVFPSLLLSTNIWQRWEQTKHEDFHVFAVHYRLGRWVMFRRKLREFMPSLSILFNAMAFYVATGLAIVEWMLGIPGLGRWTLESILRLDIPVVFLCGVVSTFVIATLFAVEDLLKRGLAADQHGLV